MKGARWQRKDGRVWVVENNYFKLVWWQTALYTRSWCDGPSVARLSPCERTKESAMPVGQMRAVRPRLKVCFQNFTHAHRELLSTSNANAMLPGARVEEGTMALTFEGRSTQVRTRKM